MLTQIQAPVASTSSSATTAPQADKTIAIGFYGSSGTLVYTVPAGRKFVGNFWNAAGGSVDAGYVVLSGASIDLSTTNFNSSTQSTWPPYSGQYPDYSVTLTLRAGDKLHSSPNNSVRVRINGVESDA